MNIRLYTIKDSKADCFGKIFMFENDEQAKRSLQVAVTQDKGISMFPDDYTLYFLGVYDDESGIIAGQVPDRLYTGMQALADLSKRATDPVLGVVKGNGVDNEIVDEA